MTARCLIPAAGRGTRLLPVTRVIPKELLPVGTRPLLQWCLTEALEAGFDEIGVVVSPRKPAVVSYVTGEAWHEGLLPSLAERARATTITTFEQEPPTGLVDAVLAARPWVEGAPFALFLPDNVRIAGRPPLTVGDVDEAARSGSVIAACHRVGPETRHYFADVSRIDLDELAPAGAAARVRTLQPRGGPGPFRAPPEGAWRLLPRTTITDEWLEEARRESAEAALAGREADDVRVMRRLVERRLLRARPWSGTIVDAGNPAGYLWAAHLLHEAGARERDARDQGPVAGDLVSIDGID